MASLLESLLTLDDGDAGFLAGLSAPTLHNWNGIDVGRLRATEFLRRSLSGS